MKRKSPSELFGCTADSGTALTQKREGRSKVEDVIRELENEELVEKEEMLHEGP